MSILTVSFNKTNFSFNFLGERRVRILNIFYYFEDILPLGDHEVTTEFLQKIVDLMFGHIQKTNDRNEKVKTLFFNFYFKNEFSKLTLD